MAIERQPDGVYMGWFSWHRADTHAGARTTHIVYIPWDDVQGAEWTAKTEQWNLRTGNRFTILHYQAGAVHDALTQVSGDPGGVVYIRGHGSAGAPYIQTKTMHGGEEQTHKLSIEDACARLIENGLQSSFPGAIKFYSCYSGTKPTAATLAEDQRAAASSNARYAEALRTNLITQEQHDRWRREPARDRSMARQGGDYLRAHGFQSCVMYGYLGPLGSEYEQDSGTLTWHKKVELDGLVRRPSHLDGLKTTRPSVARIRV